MLSRLAFLRGYVLIALAAGVVWTGFTLVNRLYAPMQIAANDTRAEVLAEQPSKPSPASEDEGNEEVIPDVEESDEETLQEDSTQQEGAKTNQKSDDTLVKQNEEDDVEIVRAAITGVSKVLTEPVDSKVQLASAFWRFPPVEDEVNLASNETTETENKAPQLGSALPPQQASAKGDNSKLQQLDFEQVVQRVGTRQIFPGKPSVTIGLADIITQALTHSKNIQALRFLPAEELQTVEQELGNFDWRGFIDSQFSQDNQPFGDSLQTAAAVGAIDSVRNDDNEVQYGVRKNTKFGGTLELGKAFGTRDTNSGLFVPEDQGNAALRVTFSQELLRDGGRDIVLSRALIASLNADQAHAQSFSEISNLLQEVLNRYWDLYQARGNYFISLSLMEWAEDTLRVLESRREIDAEENTIEQARALLLESKADLANAKAAVQIAQDELYRLVNASAIDADRFELLTIEAPRPTDRQFRLVNEVPIALANRAEITQSLSEIQEAAITHKVSLNQLLPQLTFSIESSLNGLDSNFDIFGATSNLTDTDPSYQANLNFEYFFQNRTARAQNKQAQLALRRLHLEYEDQIEQVRLDVARAIRTLNASTEILKQRQDTLLARQKEIEFLRVRRDIIPQASASTSLLFEQFFQAINRLINSQQAYVAALSNQQTAFADLLQAKGLLLNISEVPRDLPVAVPSPQSVALERRLERRANLRSHLQGQPVQP